MVFAKNIKTETVGINIYLTPKWALVNEQLLRMSFFTSPVTYLKAYGRIITIMITTKIKGPGQQIGWVLLSLPG